MSTADGNELVATGRLEVERRHCNPVGTLHGGCQATVLGTIADAAVEGLVAGDGIGASNRFGATSIQMHYLGPGGGVVHATATARRPLGETAARVDGRVEVAATITRGSKLVSSGWYTFEEASS